MHSSRSLSFSACISRVRIRAMDHRGLASLYDGLRDRRQTSSSSGGTSGGISGGISITAMIIVGL